MKLAVLVPVLERPHRVRPTIDAFAPHHVYFVPNTDDDEEIEAIREAGGDILYCINANYARKINGAIKLTKEPLIFIGADDLEPQPGWFEAALQYIADGSEVVGINDMISRSRIHSTHFLITREYAEQSTITGDPGPLCEDYEHSCIDDELIATAQKRGVYSYAIDSLVKHLHPDMGWSPHDATYHKARTNIRADKRLWRSRRYWYLEDK